MLVVLSAGALFGFYGAAGWSDHGAVSHEISVASVWVMLPAVAILEWWFISRVSPGPLPDAGTLGSDQHRA